MKLPYLQIVQEIWRKRLTGHDRQQRPFSDNLLHINWPELHPRPQNSDQ